MKSSLDVIEIVYQVINIPEITSIISGKVYNGHRPNSSELEDITIQTLANSSEYLQKGFINVNFYAKEIESGRPDLAKFKQVIDVLIPKIDELNLFDTYIQIDDDKGVFKDQDSDNTYFYNLRLRFQTI